MRPRHDPDGWVHNVKIVKPTDGEALVMEMSSG